MLLAALLRLNHVTQPLIDAFSWRQASTAMMADNFFRHDWNILFPQVSWSGPGPSYQGREFQTVSYLSALLYTVFGEQEIIGRLISITAGTWGVFALYGLARRIWDHASALAAGLMLAILPGAVFIDRSFLPDPMMLALTTTAAWAYVAHLQTGRRTYLIVAGCVGTLALLTKLPGLVVLAPLAYATFAIRRRQEEKSRVALWPIVVCFALMLIPIAAYYAWAVYLGSHYPPYHIAGSANWVWKDGLGKWLSKNYYLHSLARSATVWLWTWPVIGLGALGLLFRPRPQGNSQSVAWFFHVWMFGCVLLWILGARELSENVWNMHVFNIPAAAMAGHGVVLIARQGTSRRAAIMRLALMVVMILGYGQVVLGWMYGFGKKEDSYLLGLALRDQAAPNELVVTIADDVGDPISIYYSRRNGWVFPPAHLPEIWKPWNLFPPDDEKSIAMFEDLRQRGAHWLGIVSKPKDDTPGKADFWSTHRQLVEHFNRTCELKVKNDDFVIYRIRSVQELSRQNTHD